MRWRRTIRNYLAVEAAGGGGGRDAPRCGEPRRRERLVAARFDGMNALVAASADARKAAAA
jgi:hypothetical protein